MFVQKTQFSLFIFSISAQSSSRFTVPFFRYQSIALVLSIDTRLFIGNKGHDICSASGGGIYHCVNGIFDLCIHIRCLSHYVSVPSDNVTVHLWDSMQKGAVYPVHSSFYKGRIIYKDISMSHRRGNDATLLINARYLRCTEQLFCQMRRILLC